jgi:DNA polymerase
MTKKSLFDNIIECLDEISVKKKTASISPEVLNDFMTAAKPEFTQTPSQPHNRHDENVSSHYVQRDRHEQQPQQEHYTRNQPAAKAVHVTAPIQKVDVENLNFDELCSVTMNCHLCRLHTQRTQVVFGEGNPQAELMFIGEGPGQEEDLHGRPFVGAAGQLLDKMIIAMQFTREEVYIANVVKCRPPGNRAPEPDEANQCLPYLEKQIQLINPKVIVLLGAVAMRYVIKKEGISRERGSWQEYHGIKVMPTYHPAYLLRNPSAKKDVWSDLQQVMQVFGKTPKK